jgi:hypothetical protein
VGFSASCARRLRLRDFEWRLLGFGMTVSKSFPGVSTPD